MNARSEAECYTRYRPTARRFELFGAAILAAGVLCYTAFGDSVKWPGVALGAVGLCAFALGAASLRPHNVVKSFALQCMQNPNEEYARGLLNALTAGFDDVDNLSISPKSLAVTYNTIQNPGLWSTAYIIVLPIGILLCGFLFWLKRRKL